MPVAKEHPSHVYVITVRSMSDYRKMMSSLGKHLIWRAKRITLVDGTVIKKCECDTNRKGI